MTATSIAEKVGYEVLFPSRIAYSVFVVIVFTGNTIYSINYEVLLQVLIMESILMLCIWAMSGR